MKANEFLQELLESQALSESQLNDLSNRREEVERYLREKYGQEPSIRYAGSKAKGTMIAENYDLDLTCYFPSSNESTLKELHDSVEKTLAQEYNVERKASAVRIKKVNDDFENDYHIDVVPGRFVDGKEGDVFLHVVYGEKERIQTNIDTHVSYVKESGCQDIIKLVKLWKVRNSVSLKTFVLEIFVIENLKGSRTKDDLVKSLRFVLEELKGKIATTKLIDPANSNNVVSEVMTAFEKEAVAARASGSITVLEENKEDETLGWKKVFDEDTGIQKWAPPVIISNPSKPWCAS